MGDLALRIDDDTVVWLRADPLDSPGSDETKPTAPPGPSADQRPDADGDLELPDAFGSAQPVSVDSRLGRALGRGGEVLEEALRPLGGVLGQIHRSIAGSSHRPDEVTVQFGVTLGSDLKLGVFAGKGEASFTVSATWNLDRDAAARGDAGAATGAGGAAP
ncbi:CU044_2847 family protein [Streptomyces piniterrae]|uniref:CU044_2847 family protein n=1 Tax=Streptomyces piniterrae TaxID=2571125 RepID=UPI001C9E5607|nr:CU044_2847 family protein [Streptomyces piniterrae]